MPGLLDRNCPSRSLQACWNLAGQGKLYRLCFLAGRKGFCTFSCMRTVISFQTWPSTTSRYVRRCRLAPFAALGGEVSWLQLVLAMQLGQSQMNVTSESQLKVIAYCKSLNLSL